MTGWGWLRKVPEKAVDLKKRTVSSARERERERERERMKANVMHIDSDQNRGRRCTRSSALWK